MHNVGCSQADKSQVFNLPEVNVWGTKEEMAKITGLCAASLCEISLIKLKWFGVNGCTRSKIDHEMHHH